jgi:flavin-dependent dehydrogenase
MAETCDVAIIGGGPAGTTTGTLLKKYNPDLKVLIFEREKFPRDHIGESLLPPTSTVINEMGAWDKIEAANFPIKLGATYRWGKNPELWDFDFIPVERFKEEPRPAPYRGIRTATAFQVDRSVYDTILLDHAKEMGCEVRQETKVASVSREGDRVNGLVLADGETITARHYVDASGNSGILRRAMGVECDYHPNMQNIAIWDYWQNAEWAVNIGVGGTRIQVRSLPYGWIWFIPLGPTRTSIGLVIPVEYYKSSGKKPAELYEQALKEETTYSALLAKATSEGNLTTTKDWSFIADRSYGENWYLVGECAGFADPILSVGVTMAHVSGRQLAYTINAIESGGNAAWLMKEFDSRQRQRIQTHIRFGDYWYTANEQFKDLKEYTTKLANAVGLELSPEKAWDWIARGGFIDEEATVGLGGFQLPSLKGSKDFLADLKYDSPLETNNVFKLNLSGATTKLVAMYFDGRVTATDCYERDGKVLPMTGAIPLIMEILEKESEMGKIHQRLVEVGQQNRENAYFMNKVLPQVATSMEGMVLDGWLIASRDSRQPTAKLNKEFAGFHPNEDVKA